MEEVVAMPTWLTEAWADADAAFDANLERWAEEADWPGSDDETDFVGRHKIGESPAVEQAVQSSGQRIDADMLRLGAAIDRLVVLEAEKASLDAEQAMILAALTGPEPDGEALIVDELRCALRISATAVRSRLETARLLRSHLPVTLRALADGRCSWRHAQAAVDAVLTVLPALDATAIARLDGVAADAVTEETIGGVRRVLARAVIAVDPRGADRRHQLAHRERRVCVYGESDAMASLVLTSSATDIAAVYATVDAAARSSATNDPLGSDPRTMDARRADALVGAVLCGDVVIPSAVSDVRPQSGDASASGDAGETRSAGATRTGRTARSDTSPRNGRSDTSGSCTRVNAGRGARIEVTVSAATLSGDTDEPGYLAGYGPIPPGLARRVAAEPTSTWRRLVTDPMTGALLDYGRRTYRPPADLRDFVTARDGTCAFPGCTVPARRCDLDHVRPFGVGPTAPDNLAPLCRRHHRAKTLQKFTYRREDDGAHRWTLPSGHQYSSRPPRPWTAPPS